MPGPHSPAAAPTSTGRTRLGRSAPEASPTVRYIEAKEVVGGFSVLETDTMGEAVEIASTWPGIDRGIITVEVRPVIEH